ncbi:MAG: calcium-translocating P-type ATPase, PMCA-type [Bacteroidaceae bacterium]|nr:calcium-translocating P-type ATPase, PMCA-type [Bacteroidaceae bacterium]
MPKKDLYRKLCLDNSSEEILKGKEKNIIPPPEKEPLWKGFFGKFKDPLIIVLLVVFFFSIVVSTYEVFYQGASYSSYIEPCGVLVALLLATGVGFWFEVKAAKEFDVLNQVKNKRKVKVIRKVDNKYKTLYIPKHDVVVGDIVILESGDEIPADGIVLDSNNLKVDESDFTGELYASKNAEITEGISETAYPTNILLRSSTVIEGEAVMQVTKIGTETEEGKGVLQSHEDNDIKSPLNKQLDDLGRYISIASFVIAGLIVVGRLIYYYVTVGNVGGFEWIGFLEMLLNSIMIAVALIVVAVPEGLPMSVTVSLALSMRKMLKENNLVRKLHACETMGAATVICTDKTGTLTENKMQVMECYASDETDMDLLAQNIAINSTATLSNDENGVVSTIGNPTEGALLKWIVTKEYDYESIRENASVNSAVPFSTEIKRMETVTADGYRFVKGAPEIVIDMCDDFGSIKKDNILRKLKEYQAKGMRTLAFAYQLNNGNTIFQAIVAIADPVRSDVAEAINICRNSAHVRVIMVTGDNALTAGEIAKQAGLTNDNENVIALTGGEFEALSDAEAKEIIGNPDFKILSRAKPNDKARLVGLLQELGHVVAVTGDGTNDAPALKKAQVGLSMGDGTARAKEASDITIIDNSFASINTAILWGRSLYQNIRRFIIFQMTINVAACLIVLYGAFMGLDSPLNVTQMLWVNLIMDTFAAMALSSLPADHRVMSDYPRKTDSKIIDGGMGKMILGIGLFFFIMLVIIWQMLSHGEYTTVLDLLRNFDIAHITDFSKATHVRNPHELGIFFTFFVLLQFWNIFNARYYRTGRSLIQDIGDIICHPSSVSKHYSTGFISIIFIILIGQILITNVFGKMFSVEALPINDWMWLIAVTCPVLVIGDLYRFIRNKIA